MLKKVMNILENSKALKSAVLVVFNIVTLPITVPIGIISKLVKFRIIRMRDDRIGHLIGNTQLFISKRESNNNKINYICLSSSRPVNNQLVKMFKQRLKIIQISDRIINCKLSQLITTRGSLLRIMGAVNIMGFDPYDYDSFNKIKPLKFSKKDKIKGKILLEKMGVNKEFICFHSRTKKYLDDLLMTDTSHFNYRDDNIKDYLKSVDYITSKNLFALRMGIEKKPLKFKTNNKVIDYAFKYRSDFGDVYLAANCKFFLGNTSGISFVASMFNTPVVSVNIIPYAFFPIMKSNLFIPKKIFDKKKNRILTFKEVVERQIIYFTLEEEYKQENLIVINNTPEEILEVVKEMNERIDGTWKTNKEFEELQTQFKKIFEKTSCARFPSRMGSMFLKKNKYLLD